LGNAKIDIAAKKTTAEEQLHGRKPDRSGQLLARGLIEGGNTYTIVSDGSGWIGHIPLLNKAALIAHPPTITTANPFSFELTWDMIDCLINNNSAVLLSDGTYNHLTMFWQLDRSRGRYGFADQRPDSFFLANKNNLLGIESQQQKIRNGPIVSW